MCQTRLNPALLAGLTAMAVNVAGCAPNRAQWMQEAAQKQAQSATASIGDEQQVRLEAREASAVLTKLASNPSVVHPPKGLEQGALIFLANDAEIISGLQAIADSRSDAEFTTAVFAMCDEQRKAAAPPIGRGLIGVAHTFQVMTPPPNMTD